VLAAMFFASMQATSSAVKYSILPELVSDGELVAAFAPIFVIQSIKSMLRSGHPSGRHPTGMGGFDIRHSCGYSGHSHHDRGWPRADHQLSVIGEYKRTFATPQVSSQFDRGRGKTPCKMALMLGRRRWV
jgi:hypothetical protein